jgi:hypothetical protein
MIILVNNDESGDEAVVGYVDTLKEANTLIEAAVVHRHEYETRRNIHRTRGEALSKYLKQNSPHNKHPGRRPTSGETTQWEIDNVRFKNYVELVVEKQLTDQQVRQELILQFEEKYPQFKVDNLFKVNETLLKIHSYIEAPKLNVKEITNA